MMMAHVSLPGRGQTDACLAEAVRQMLALGLPLAGTVQDNTERPGRARCDMDLRVLPGGPVLRISQDLGAAARGCRLDAHGLEEAVATVARRLPQARLLVVNKFGKHESQGRGFVPVIVEALDRGLPVLVGVNGLNLDAWLTFAAGLSAPLAADPALILRWARDTTQAALLA